MKAIFISFNQAVTDRIMKMLDENGIQGFTMFPLTHGRGSFSGEPHMGNHTWPAMNSTVLAIVENDKVEPAMAAIRKIDADTQLQGLRAFVWNIEDAM